MSVKFIVDSTADMTDEIKARCAVVPLMVRFGEEEYIDGVTITHREFYQKLVESDELPRTSQPTPEAFATEYKKAIDEGNEVVVVTISSKLSGTYQSASIAAMDFEGKVFVVDSLNAALATGMLAELGLRMADEGMGAAEIAERLTVEREKVVLYAKLDTLEYLKKGGRISKTVAFAGELLSLKPIISVPEGAVAMVGKARGAKQAGVLMNKLIADDGGVDYSKPYLAGWTGLDDTQLNNYLADSADVWTVDGKPVGKTMICSVIGTHVGPGAVAVAYFKK